MLEEVAKSWKKCGGAVIVDGDAKLLKDILKTVEGCMSGGKIIQGRSALSRQSSFAFGADSGAASPTTSEGGSLPPSLEREGSFGLSGLQVDEDEDKVKDPREWIKVISAFEQPRLGYNGTKKHFEVYVTLFQLSLQSRDSSTNYLYKGPLQNRPSFLPFPHKLPYFEIDILSLKPVF